MDLFIDLETRSELSVRDAGAFAYAEHPSTRILCCAWALDDGPVECLTYTDFIGPDGEQLTSSLAAVIDRFPGARLVSHNNDFERCMLSRVLGPAVLDREWDDTAVWAACLGLPRSLEDLSAFLWPDDPEKQKDAEGHRVMMQLSVPRRPSKTNPDQWWTPLTKPEAFAKLYAYCMRDVRVMREAKKRLRPPPPHEVRVWQVTTAMNMRGIRIDLESIPRAQAHLAKHLQPLEEEFASLCPHPPKSYARVAAHFGMENVKKATIREALRRPDLDPRVHRGLELLRQLSLSSPAKLEAMLQRVSRDGRLRGALVYGGAERTLRWSSWGVQLQNMKRGLGELTDAAFEALALGALAEIFAGIDRQAPEAPADEVALIAEMLRGFLVGPFLVGDYAQIEARVLAWTAGERSLLDVFANHGDPYSVKASDIYGRKITKKDKAERFMGKQVVLGCFEASTLVLTHRGWCPIVDVHDSDMVWDGVEWVTHGGAVCQGQREVVQRLGVEATPEHLSWTGDAWMGFESLARPENMRHLVSGLLSASSAWKATFSENGVACLPSRCLAPVSVGGFIALTPTTCGKGGPRDVLRALEKRVLSRQANGTGGMQTSSPTSPTGSACSIELPRASLGATTQNRAHFGTTGAAGSGCTRRGGATEETSCGTCSRCPDGTTPAFSSTESTTPADTSPGTCASCAPATTCGTDAQSPICSSEFRSLKTVYDIAHAGPRARFTILTEIGPLIVHNCGYAMGHVRFRNMLAEVYDLEITEEFAKKVVGAYRASVPRIVRLWDVLMNGFRFVVTNKSKKVKIPDLPVAVFMGTEMVGGTFFAWIELPSGRRLWYADAHVKDREVRYYGRNIYKGGAWELVPTHGGKITENIVQAAARDVMADAMVRLDEAGFLLEGTVHDELIAAQDVPDEQADARLEEFRQHMVTLPAWAKGLPVDAEVFRCTRYRK